MLFGCTRMVLADSGTGTVAYTDLPFCFSFLHQYVSPHPFVSGQKKEHRQTAVLFMVCYVSFGSASNCGHSLTEISLCCLQ